MHRILSSALALALSTGLAFGQAAQSVAPFQSANVGSHFVPAGAAPILSGCSGAGSALNANSTDANGRVTGQTAVSTTCTITFANPYTVIPSCVATGETAAILTMTASTTALIETHASVASFIWDYVCEGK